MKQFLHSFALRVTMLCALLVGLCSSGVWADEVTFTPTDFSGQGTTNTGSEISATKSGVTIWCDRGFGTSELRCYSGGDFQISSDNTITALSFTFSGGKTGGLSTSYNKLSTNLWRVESLSSQARFSKIVVTYEAPAKTDPTITFNNGSIRVGQDLDLSTLFTSNSTGAVTYSITAGDSYATLDGSTLTGDAVGSVTVKATQAEAGNYNAGEASATITVNAALTLSSIAITTAPTKTTYTEGETFDPTGMVVTATYSDESTDDVTASCTFSPNTVLTPSNTEITVSYTENEVNKTATQAITVNPLPKYTVAFNDGGSVTQASYGAEVTLPSRDNIDDYAFAGWSATNVPSETTTVPTIISAGSYTPTENITLYPVYKKTEGDSAPSAFSVGNTGNFAIVAEISDGEYYALPTSPTVNNGKITAQEITVSELNDVKYVTPANASGFTWTIATATNGYTLSDGSHYIYHSNGGNSGTNLAYGDATTYTWSFTADGNYIKMAGMNGSTTNNRGLLFSGTTIGGYALSNWGSYNKTMILPVANAGTTYYWSTPVADAVARPIITPDENPFTFSTDVEITCETDGATIYYTLDGTDPTNESTEYSDAFEITSACTIKAIAIKGEDVSSIATIPVTKNLATPTVTVSGDLTVDLNGETDVNAGTLTAAVTYNEAAVDGATVTWSSSDSNIATINPSTGAVVIKTRGTVTFTATYAGNSDYAEATGTKQITVTDSKAPGTEARPYTVAEAIDATPASGTSANVYIQGYVSAFYSTSIVGDGSNYRYYISDDGTTTSQLLVYRGKKNSTDNFSNASDLEIGDKVTIYGGLTTYNSTKEVASGNYIVTRVEKPASDLAKTSDITLDVKNNALTANISDHISSSSAGTYTFESADPTVATVSAGGVVTGLKVGTTTITVNQASTLSYKAGSVEIPVTVADTRVDATTIPGINISALTEGADDGTIEVVNPIKADEGVTFSFSSSDAGVLHIDGNNYSVKGIGTVTVTVTATASNSALYKNVTETFEVTVNAAVKSENEIEIAFDSYSTEWGTNLEGLASGSTGFDGVITATSSNANILTVAVDAEGNVTVTPVAVGTATVTFSAVETASFLAAENVQQVFTVTAPEGKTTAPSSEVTYTFDFTDNKDWNFPTDYATGEHSYTKDGKTILLNTPDDSNGYKFNSNVLLIGKSGATLTLPAFDKAVTKISTSGKSGASSKVSQNIYVGETAVSTATTDATTNHEYAISSSYQAIGTIYTLKVTNGNNTQIPTLTVHMLQAPTATVTLNKYGFATYCSVNPMDFSSTEGYTAWRVSNVSGDGTITLDKITEAIKGGQGVLLYNKEADGDNTTDVTVTFANGTTEFTSSENKLFGTTAPTYVSANEYFGLSGDQFVKVKVGTVKAGKALLPYFDKEGGIKSFTLIFNDSETGVTETKTVSREVFETIFDLNGRRLSQPQRGINIVNGRKVVVK